MRTAFMPSKCKKTAKEIRVVASGLKSQFLLLPIDMLIYKIGR